MPGSIAWRGASIPGPGPPSKGLSRSTIRQDAPERFTTRSCDGARSEGPYGRNVRQSNPRQAGRGQRPRLFPQPAGDPDQGLLPGQEERPARLPPLPPARLRAAQRPAPAGPDLDGRPRPGSLDGPGHDGLVWPGAQDVHEPVHRGRAQGGEGGGPVLHPRQECLLRPEEPVGLLLDPGPGPLELQGVEPPGRGHHGQGRPDPSRPGRLVHPGRGLPGRRHDLRRQGPAALRPQPRRPFARDPDLGPRRHRPPEAARHPAGGRPGGRPGQIPRLRLQVWRPCRPPRPQGGHARGRADHDLLQPAGPAQSHQAHELGRHAQRAQGCPAPGLRGGPELAQGLDLQGQALAAEYRRRWRQADLRDVELLVRQYRGQGGPGRAPHPPCRGEAPPHLPRVRALAQAPDGRVRRQPRVLHRRDQGHLEGPGLDRHARQGLGRRRGARRGGRR